MVRPTIDDPQTLFEIDYKGNKQRIAFAMGHVSHDVFTFANVIGQIKVCLDPGVPRFPVAYGDAQVCLYNFLLPLYFSSPGTLVTGIRNIHDFLRIVCNWDKLHGFPRHNETEFHLHPHMCDGFSSSDSRCAYYDAILGLPHHGS